MWKCPGKWRTASGSTSFRDCRPLLALSLATVLFACASHGPLYPPRVTLVNPASFQSVETSSAYKNAYKAYEKGDQRHSRMDFQKALKKHPSSYPSLLGIAYTYLAEGNMDFAERYVHKALEYQPDYAQAHYALAFILESKQDYEGALAELNRLNELRPDYPGLEQNRNILRLKSVELHLSEARSLAATDPEAALEHYNKAREMAPEVSQIPMEMAQVLISHNRCADAIPYLQEVLRTTPGDPEAQMKLADCLSEEGQYTDALGLYETLADANPTDEVRQKVEDTRKIIAFGKMPEEYQQIAHAEQINRAQLAALLVTELPFLQKYRMTSSEIMVDIINHWAKTYIQKVVDLGIMDVFPNRTFEPQQPITRLELAKAAYRLVQILETGEGKQFAPPPENLIIPDVFSTNVNYQLVSTAISAGVLSLDADGRFHPYRPVSGAEVLSMVNRLKTLSE